MSQMEGAGSATPAGAAAPADAGAAGVGGAEGAAAGVSDNGQGDKGASSTDALADSLLTRGEGDKGADQSGKENAEGKKPEGQEEADPMAAIPATPDGYDLKFGEDVTVDEGLLKSFKDEAHSLGIPQGQAQKLADFYVKHMGESFKGIQQAQNNAMLEAKKGWEAEITSRPEFKQEVADARRTLKAFGGPELDPLLNQSMLGSHPAFFDFVVKVGKALAEPDARGAGYGSGKEKPLADRLWPSMK